MKVTLLPLALLALGTALSAAPQNRTTGERATEAREAAAQAAGQERAEAKGGLKKKTGQVRGAAEKRGAQVGGAAKERGAAGGGMMPMARAGEEHKVLRLMEGDWNAEMTNFMGPAPTKFTGLEKNRVVANGLWLQQCFEGNFMGQAFEGYGTAGYGPGKGHYVGTWIDSMSSRISMMEAGKADQEARTLIFEVMGKNPMTGEATKERHTHMFAGKDKRGFKIDVINADGSTTKMMGVAYTRRTGPDRGMGEKKVERQGGREHGAGDGHDHGSRGGR